MRRVEREIPRLPELPPVARPTSRSLCSWNHFFPAAALNSTYARLQWRNNSCSRNKLAYKLVELARS